MPESVKVTVLQVDSFRHTNKHGLANCCLLQSNSNRSTTDMQSAVSMSLYVLKKEYNNKMLDNQKSGLVIHLIYLFLY